MHICSGLKKTKQKKKTKKKKNIGFLSFNYRKDVHKNYVNVPVAYA